MGFLAVCPAPCCPFVGGCRGVRYAYRQGPRMHRALHGPHCRWCIARRSEAGPCGYRQRLGPGFAIPVLPPTGVRVGEVAQVTLRHGDATLVPPQLAHGAHCVCTPSYYQIVRTILPQTLIIILASALSAGPPPCSVTRLGVQCRPCRAVQHGQQFSNPVRNMRIRGASQQETAQIDPHPQVINCVLRTVFTTSFFVWGRGLMRI